MPGRAVPDRRQRCVSTGSLFGSGRRRLAVLLAVLLSGGASSAFAEWVKMAGNDSVDAYMDLNLLERKGEYVLSWRLYDYRRPQKASPDKTFRSAATLVATKCAERTEAMMSYIQYAEAMGKGSVITSQEIPKDKMQVSKIAPGSIGEALNKVACQRFKMW
jgi:hypothetical protein